MRFILLALSLLIISNSHAEIDGSNYIYESDDKETISVKEDLNEAREKVERANLKAIQNYRKKGKSMSALSDFTNEIVYKVGDASKNNIGAKIGMTPDQVLKTYWRQPDMITKDSDELGSLEQWNYQNYGTLIFDNGKLVSIWRLNSCVKCTSSRLK